VWVEYLSNNYHDMLRQGWSHWCDYVEDGMAMMVFNFDEVNQ
jgi:hypothetical protein